MDRAHDLLARALNCWRGRALCDIHDLSAAQAEIARLDRLRLGAVEAFAEVSLIVGMHNSVIELLEAELRAFPLAERLTSHLMVALYRAGRQADALRAFSYLEQRLDAELGTQPSRDLRELEEKVLLQAPTLNFVARVPSRSDISRTSPRLVGRRDQLEQLGDLCTDPTTDTRLVVLWGDAGAGKTALLEESLRRVDESCVSLAVHCTEDGPAYAPIVELIHAAKARVPSNDSSVVKADLILDFFSHPDVHAEIANDDSSQLLRLLEGITDTLEAVNAARLILAVEDLHWIDPASTRVLRYVARHRNLDHVLILATARSDGANAHAAALIAHIASPAQSSVIPISGFDDYETRAFIKAVAPSRLSSVLGEVAPLLRELTRGNAFHIETIVHELAALPGVPNDARELSELVAGLAPESIRALIQRRLERVSKAALRVLQAASVVNDAGALDLLASIVGLPYGEFFSVIDELIVDELLTEPASGGVEFKHALIRNAVNSLMDNGVRQRIHARVATVLAEAQQRSAEVAYHLLAAGGEVDARTTIRFTIAAGREAMDSLAFADAIHWYEATLDFCELDVDDRARTLLDISKAYRIERRFADAKDACILGAEYARASGNALLLAEFALEANSTWADGFGANPECRALLAEALADEYLDSARRARLLARLGTALYYVNPDEERAAVEECTRLASATHDIELKAEALLARHLWLTHTPPARNERLEIATSSRDLVLGNASLWLRAQRELLTDELENGEVDAFEVELDRYSKRAQDELSPRDMYWGAVLNATLTTLRGDLLAAEQLVRGAELRGDELEQRTAGTAFLQRFMLRYQQGRLFEMVGMVIESSKSASAYRAGGAVGALAYAECGRVDDAVDIANSLIGSDGETLPRDAFWLAAHAMLVPVAAKANDEGLAKILWRQISQCPDHVVTFGAGAAVFGCTSQWLGELAIALEDWDEAIDRLLVAVDRLGELRAPYWLAHARLDLAEAYRRRRRPGDARASDDVRDEVGIAVQDLDFGRLSRSL